MGCLKDIQCGGRVIIGIRDYKDCTNPESNLFINDIPGITLKSAAAIANEEQISGYELLKSFTKRSVQLVFEEFYAQAIGHVQFNAIAETRKLNYFNSTTLPVSASERGLILKRWRSEMAQILIQEVYVKAANTCDVTVKIIDGNHNEEKVVHLIADQEKAVRFDYLATEEQVKIVINNTSLNVYTGPISQEYTGCSSCPGYNQQGLYFSGWNGSSEESKYFGIGALASVRCYEENILCQLLNRMSFLFWYKAGIMYYEELLSSNRLNPITLYSKEAAISNLENLELKYQKAFTNFIPTIKQFLLSTKGECLTCNSSIRYANSVRV